MQHRQSLYYGDLILDYARVYLKNIPSEVKIIVCASSSGMSLASAIAVLGALEGRQFKISYIKKAIESFRYSEEEDRGFVCISGCREPYELPSIFVDDLIDGANTFSGVVDHIRSMRRNTDKNWLPNYIMVYDNVYYNGEDKLIKHYEFPEDNIIELNKIDAVTDRFDDEY